MSASLGVVQKILPLDAIEAVRVVGNITTEAKQ